MNSVHRHMLNIYNGIYVAAMSIAIQMLIGTYTGTGYMYGLLAVSVLVTGTGLEYLSSAGQGMRRKAIIIMILGCVALACITVAGLFAEGLSAHVLPGYSAAEGEQVLPFAYRLSVTIISAVFITLLCEIILRIPFISGIAPCFLIIFIIGSRISGVIVELEVFILALYVFIITVCKAGRDVHYMYMTPVIMIFCAMLYIIPTGTEPMSWNNVWKVIDTAGRSISDVWMDVMEATGLDRLDGNVRRIGYSDSEDIDIVDEIVGNNRTQLTVTGRQCASSIYLRGSYYNEYNGSGWQRNYSDKSYPEYEVMLFETLNNMLNFGEDNPKTIYNNISKITIQYKSLRTDNVFVPYNTVRKEMNNDTEYDNGVLKFTNSAKEGDSYKIWYFNMREDAKEAVYGSNGWEQYNKALDIVRYADMYADCNLIGNIDNILVQDIDDLLAGRKEYVKDNYMNIPECVPERVYKLAKDIKNYGHPILFRLNNEMNSDWTSYGVSACLNDPDIYVELWQKFYNIFREAGVDNTIWVFNPNNESFPPHGYNATQAFYPGDEYVQVFGVTGYNTGTYYSANNEKWKTFDDIYGDIYERHHDTYVNFPWIITEFASSSIGGDKVKWINDMFKDIKKYPNIRMAFWFNSADYDLKYGKDVKPARPYWLDETDETLNAFKNGLKN